MDVSVELEEFITKLVPAVTVPTDRVPAVPPIVFTESKITLLAVTAVVLTVTVPATSVEEPTIPAAPVGAPIRSSVCLAVHVFACPRAIEATAAPVVGLIVRVPSVFEIEVTETPESASHEVLPEASVLRT